MYREESATSIHGRWLLHQNTLLFKHSKRSYYSKWIFYWLILYHILNHYCNVLILELMLGSMRVRLGINIPNQHLQQFFFMYWGYKNLFSYQNFRNLVLQLPISHKCPCLSLPVLQPFVAPYIYESFLQLLPELFWQTLQWYFASSELQPPFSNTQ